MSIYKNSTCIIPDQSRYYFLGFHNLRVRNSSGTCPMSDEIRLNCFDHFHFKTLQLKCIHNVLVSIKINLI